MLTNRTLQHINNRPRKVSRLPLLAGSGGTLVLAALLYVLKILPPIVILAVIGSGAMLFLILYKIQSAKMTISLSYKGNLGEEVVSRFSEVQQTLKGLASSERIWRLADSARLPKAGEVSPSPERKLT